MAHQVFGFVDGENLLLRYEDMVKNGAIPKPDVIHIPGLLVWHPSITTIFLSSISRIAFYQTIVGSQEKVDEARKKVCDVHYTYRYESASGTGSLYPRLFNKETKGMKTKSVDINISVDVLRSIMNGTGDVILLLSGDGDYLPLVEEVVRHGKQVWLGAFSKGLSPNLRFAADEFFNLDAIFFQPTPAPA